LSDFNGFGEVLSAFSQLKDPHYRLIIAGSGPLERTITGKARADSRIEFLGLLEYEELLAVHSGADVLVSMRLTKKMNTAYAFPSKTFEYLLSGVPVITTTSGHMASEYGPYCFIVEDENADALAAKLLQIESLGAAERARIGVRARTYITENKTWERQQMRIANFVSSVVAGRN
jgi:glycosyltransferase involved in cell wall biosynthesis